MEILIWIGAGFTGLGVIGLIWCIVQALGLRRSGKTDAEMRLALQRLVPLNLACLGVSAMGLISVTAGIMLG